MIARSAWGILRSIMGEFISGVRSNRLFIRLEKGFLLLGHCTRLARFEIRMDTISLAWVDGRMKRGGFGETDRRD